VDGGESEGRSILVRVCCLAYVCGGKFARTNLERFLLDEANVRVYSGVYAW
jgi:hypothetical protein